MRHFYSGLFYLILPWAFLRLLWRSRRNPAYRQRWAERLGYVPLRVQASIWVHAASVGETLAAIPLINALQTLYPQSPIVVTNMTITGAARTQAVFGASVHQLYVPYDVPGAVSRFLDRVQPRLLIVIETELWPNLFALTQARGIPIFLANARLSEKSAKGYARIKQLTQGLLQTITIAAVQTRIEAERFIALGLPADRAEVTGSIKFDISVPDEIKEKARALRATWPSHARVWIAASTHASEEEVMFVAHRELLKTYPDALLLLAPRHPERFAAVLALAIAQGFKVARRSLQEPVQADTQVYLCDTMGELVLLYAASDVAFVGGSLVDIGGHNMLEAAVLAKPLIMGPELFNFAEISQKLLQQKAMFKIHDAVELSRILLNLFQDDAWCLEVGQNALRVVEANRGALAKHLKLIQAMLA